MSMPLIGDRRSSSGRYRSSGEHRHAGSPDDARHVRPLIGKILDDHPKLRATGFFEMVRGAATPGRWSSCDATSGRSSTIAPQGASAPDDDARRTSAGGPTLADPVGAGAAGEASSSQNSRNSAWGGVLDRTLTRAAAATAGG
jgi:hypothetical protein